MVMILVKVSAEVRKGIAVGHPSSVVTRTSLIIIAVLGGFLLLALNLAIIEPAYILESVNSLISSGADIYAY
jgi:hypothetical protein